MEDFVKLKVHPKLIEGIKLMGFSKPTQIQEKCIPEIKSGKDVVGQSLTGSGKTAAFGLPILEKIVPGEGIQALVLTPTRELCIQVRDNLDQMSKFLPINIRSIFGGVGYYEQKEGIKVAEIIVATPGRLLDHIGQRNIDLSTIKFVVLDEADKMFEMGFEQDVDKILSYTPKERQTVMFSATMPQAAKNIIARYLKKPVFVQEKLHVDRSLLKQVFYVVRKDQKFSLLVHLLKEKTAGPAIVFCGTKRTVDSLARGLKKNKIDALPVHGDLTQGKRNFAVNSFKSAKIDVLVATDVAARGLDIKDVSHVYNYDVPKTPEDYTHRIGRTARAGKKGDAVTLVSDRDVRNFNAILRQGKMLILEEKLPQFEEISFGSGDSSRGREFGNDRYGRRDFGRERSHGHGRGHGRERGNDFRQEYGEQRDNFSHNNRGSPRSYGHRDNFEQRSFAPERKTTHQKIFTPKTSPFSTPEQEQPQENYEQEYDMMRTQRSRGHGRGHGRSGYGGRNSHGRSSFGNRSSFGGDRSSFGGGRRVGNKSYGNRSEHGERSGYGNKNNFSRGNFSNKGNFRSANNYNSDYSEGETTFGHKRHSEHKRHFGRKPSFFSKKKFRN